MYTQQQLIQDGFTLRLIHELLPEPELQYNRYNHTRPVKVWKSEDIAMAKETDAYKAWQRERHRREERRLKRQIERYRAILEGFRGITRHYHVSRDDRVARMASMICSMGNYRGYSAEFLLRYLLRTIQTNYCYWDIDPEPLIQKDYGPSFLRIAESLVISRVYPELKNTCNQIINGEEMKLPEGIKNYWRKLDY